MGSHALTFVPPPPLSSHRTNVVPVRSSVSVVRPGWCRGWATSGERPATGWRMRVRTRGSTRTGSAVGARGEEKRAAHATDRLERTRERQSQTRAHTDTHTRPTVAVACIRVELTLDSRQTRHSSRSSLHAGSLLVAALAEIHPVSGSRLCCTRAHTMSRFTITPSVSPTTSRPQSPHVPEPLPLPSCVVQPRAVVFEQGVIGIDLLRLADRSRHEHATVQVQTTRAVKGGATSNGAASSTHPIHALTATPPAAAVYHQARLEPIFQAMSTDVQGRRDAATLRYETHE